MGKAQIILCDKCGKVLVKNEIGLTKKLVSRNSLEFFCMECLSVFLGTTKEALMEKLEQFKDEGCNLFV